MPRCFCFPFRVSQHSPSGSFQVAEGSLPLLETHEVVRLAAFDMFPATGHVEMAVYLRRRCATAPYSAPKQKKEPQEQQRGEGQEWGSNTFYKDFGCAVLMATAAIHLGLCVWNAGHTRESK